MKRLLFFLPFITTVLSFAQPLSPRIANYDIDVTLDAERKMLFGKQTIRWINKSADTLNELQFHLYMNGFRNSQSTFMKEGKRRFREQVFEKEHWGYIDVKHLRLSSGEDLTGAMEFICPDDGNEEDKTVFRLPLPKALLPGDTSTLYLEFEEKLPEPPIARTGAKKEFFFIGQWFPKVGVYIDGAWNCHQFHANSEFFADFGVYNVRMTLPDNFILGATGLEQNVTNNGNGTATHYYRAEDVHDFAWTASPEYLVVTGKEQDVDIKLLMQPDHKGQAERHMNAAKLSVKYFQNWYGDYPFPNLTVVDPRRGAINTGGMEYPTLITAGTKYGLPDGIRLVELVVIHEFGHNYWYHLLASNEFEETWLDEGINTYTEIQIMRDAYGSGDAINFMGLKLSDLQLQRGQYITQASTDVTVRKAWEYSPGSYGVNSYSKPGLILTTLQNAIGKETMQKVMRTYVERWKFKHPKSKDFIDVVNDVTGADFNRYFEQALFSNKRLDYSIERVSSTSNQKAEGFDYDVSSAGNQTQPALKDSSSDSTYYESEVVVRREGDFIFPVEIEIAFSNGEKVREQWNGEELWTRFRYVKPAMIEYATVDPDGKIPLDVNYTNNSRTLEPQSAGINKTALKLMFYLQALFDQPELLNFFMLLTSMF